MAGPSWQCGIFDLDEWLECLLSVRNPLQVKHAAPQAHFLDELTNWVLSWVLVSSGMNSFASAAHTMRICDGLRKEFLTLLAIVLVGATILVQRGLDVFNL